MIMCLPITGWRNPEILFDLSGAPGFKNGRKQSVVPFVLQDRVQDVKNDNRTKVRLNAKID